MIEAEINSASDVATSAPIDAKSLFKRCFGSLELASSLLDELESTGHERVKEIRQKAKQQDADAIALAAHSLKGATGVLCASTLQQLSAEIEQAGHAFNLEGIETLIHDISNEMKRCLDNLPQLREEMRLIKESAV